MPFVNSRCSLPHCPPAPCPMPGLNRRVRCGTDLVIPCAMITLAFNCFVFLWKLCSLIIQSWQLVQQRNLEFQFSNSRLLIMPSEGFSSFQFPELRVHTSLQSPTHADFFFLKRAFPQFVGVKVQCNQHFQINFEISLNVTVSKFATEL